MHICPEPAGMSPCARLRNLYAHGQFHKHVRELQDPAHKIADHLPGLPSMLQLSAELASVPYAQTRMEYLCGLPKG
jgi:hypothetical protein